MNFLNFELEQIRKGYRIKILGLEQELNCGIAIEKFPHPVVIKGKIDRIDEINGVLRILDYKTGKVSKSDLKHLLDISKTVHHDEGHTIIHEGDTGAGFQLILEGEARVVRGGRTAARLGPGGFFG